MRIGKTKSVFKCRVAKIDCWEEDQQKSTQIKEVYSTKYLGEVISSDGTNTENIAQRKKRGYGTVRDITKMLDKLCLGPYMFLKAVVLRNFMLVGTLLSNSEAWYNVTEVELNQLEQVDKALWCNLTEVAKIIPYDLLCLELGLEPLRYIGMRRRLIWSGITRMDIPI